MQYNDTYGISLFSSQQGPGSHVRLPPPARDSSSAPSPVPDPSRPRPLAASKTYKHQPSSVLTPAPAPTFASAPPPPSRPRTAARTDTAPVPDPPQHLRDAVNAQAPRNEMRRLRTENEVLRHALWQMGARAPLISSDRRVVGFEGADGVVHNEQVFASDHPSSTSVGGTGEQHRGTRQPGHLSQAVTSAAEAGADREDEEARRRSMEADRMDRLRRAALAATRSSSTSMEPRSKPCLRVSKPEKPSRAGGSGSRAGGRENQQNLDRGGGV
ncbi:hypothetical protein JCM8208_003908 [Rhodotorula glutinis]